MKEIDLKFGFQFEDLYKLEKLKELDNYFLSFLNSNSKELYQDLIIARKEYKTWELKHSKLSIAIAPYLEQFVVEFFSIEDDIQKSKEQYPALAKVYECKRLFVQRYALKSNITPKNTIAQLEKLISSNLSKYNTQQFEQVFAEYVLKWQKEEIQENIDIATSYALWACLDQHGIKKHQSGILFKFPHKIDFNKLVPVEEFTVNDIKTYKIPDHKLRSREGFKLTDKGCELNFAIDQSNYCIHCHNQAKDSCSKGNKADNNGCPLDEKISEMNYLKAQANIIGALAMAIIDNPMLAATGHRICNDCMKACIYQKQEPVDIPQIETRVLKDVLDLSWGVEIYSLLTRWNPLSFFQFLPKPETGAKVLVVGMGPAGFTLAHYLLNEGHTVVGIDGLKIEPLAPYLHQPIRNINAVFQELDERVVSGFGGVMEYGITNRWNKNFLCIIRLLLERRDRFKLFGGVRFGSNITPKQAFAMGFQHIALCIGAGSPKLLSIKNGMAKGIRTASDFLMSLQLGKAYSQDSLTNLQIRMPIVVIGGGLTALDTATESLAYYPKLVEKFAKNFNKSTKLNEEEQIIAQEFLDHHNLLQDSTDILQTLRSLGGVKIVYRNKLEKAPSYRLNHEELTLGLQEGVEFLEESTPTEILLDKYGYVSGLKIIQNGKQILLPAKTILIAAGTVPNIILSDEFPEVLQKENGYFKQIEDQFVTYKKDGHSMSFFGDLHPDFAGNVVKAMASAKRGYKIISKLLKEDSTINYSNFFNILEQQLISKLVEVNRLTDNIVELVINSPLAAKNFHPGQFFRLQNYYNNKTPLMEPIALTGAKVDQIKGQISTIVLEMGKSSNLCTQLTPGEPLILMGPTGTPTEISSNEKVMLVGGGLGNAVLFSIGQALRAANSEVLYFAGYRKLADRYKIEEIEKASNQIIWSCDEGIFETTREQDLSFKSNIVESILNFAKTNPKALASIDRIIVIGSDKMMHAVKNARQTLLKPFLNPKHIAIASINSPMQCMMKEICGQCIQRHIDPDTGLESYVFSCVNQDQEMDKVDFIHLQDRLAQNNLLEK